MNALRLTSSSFKDQETMPDIHSYGGGNKSPALEIHNSPKGTVSLALIMHDPDAIRRDYLHWIVWDIPPETTVIAENAAPEHATVGMNDSGKAEYMGAAPPAGTGVHHYIFDLYALNVRLELPPDTDRQTIEALIATHLIEKTELAGLYSR